MSSTRSTAEQVDRRDLRGFDRTAVALILWAQDQGATIRVSRRGHALVRGPKGRTASISRKDKTNRNALNMRADVERLFDDSKNPSEETRHA